MHNYVQQTENLIRFLFFKETATKLYNKYIKNMVKLKKPCNRSETRLLRAGFCGYYYPIKGKRIACE